jgi:phage terminase small subunit
MNNPEPRGRNQRSGRRYAVAGGDHFSGLSDRQRRFVEEYMVDLNVAAAAKRAGYAWCSGHNPYKLLNPAVGAAIDHLMAERAERTRATAEKVIAELARIAFANMADFISVDENGHPRIDFTDLARDNAAAIQSITVDYTTPPPMRKRERDRAVANGQPAPEPLPFTPTPRRVRIHLADKRAALIDLARHLGMEGRRPESEGSNAPLPEGWKGEKDIYAGRAKYVRIITGVPRPGDPTGQRGYMKRISGPPEVLPDDVLYPEEVEDEG